MVKMSDILRKSSDKNASEKEESKKVLEEAKIEIFQPKLEINRIYGREEINKLYIDGVGFIERIYNKLKQEKEVLAEEEKSIASFIEFFVTQQMQGNDIILDLINLPIKEVFLYNHVMNVFILSTDIGIGLGYDKDKLTRLGFISIFHDIGMMKFYHLLTQPRKLTEKEYLELKQHTLIAREYLARLKNKDILNWVTSTLSEMPEAPDVSEPSEDEGKEYACIIAVVEVYEAMTHLRPYRAKIHPFEAIRQLIEKKDSYEKVIVKTLIERIGGPYPIGTYVKMSSGENGVVAKRNLGFLLRPVIEITHDASGEKIRLPRMLDLSKNPTMYIKRYLLDTEIQ